MLRCAKRKHRRFWIALNCQQQISVKDGFDFEFQSRLHECDTKHAKGEDYPFVRSVYVCVPAFFVARNAGYNWMTGWMGYFAKTFRTETSETTLLKKQGQERHSGRTAKRWYAACDNDVHRDNEHRIVAPTIRIRSLAACGLTQGRCPWIPH